MMIDCLNDHYECVKFIKSGLKSGCDIFLIEDNNNDQIILKQIDLLSKFEDLILGENKSINNQLIEVEEI